VPESATPNWAYRRGDSKVDTETYPVADAISLRWYEGIGREAGQERWAFALSAKKEWRSKVRSDVEKIVGTRRDYTLIYFITNQFVRDKARAAVEDEITRNYQITVRILDRSWIVERVFEHNRVRLAIDTLKLSGCHETHQKIIGPKDTEREANLRELEEQISDSSRYTGVEYQLIEDCLQTALLARGLERPRIEVDGRFARAEHLAERAGYRQQRLRIIYTKAWSAFWWYDDFNELNRLYDQVEELAIDTMQATDLELLANLWQLLSGSVKRGQLDAAVARLDARTATLKAELERLAGDATRPNNALQARTYRLLMDSYEALRDPDRLNAFLASIKDILAAGARMVTYPVESLTNIIWEMGDILADNATFDDLCKFVITLVEQRTSEGQAGRALLHRGHQKLRAVKKYDAIRLFGRAQHKLAKDEYREEFVEALVGCSVAYEEAGLLWAARANMLMAANSALSIFLERGEIVPRSVWCLQRLVWLELQLGRPSYVLSWMELGSKIANNLILGERLKDTFIKERQAQDMVLGLLLLKTDFWDLKWLDFLPSCPEQGGLFASWMTVLYALGHEEHLRAEGAFPAEQDHDAVRKFFCEMLQQPANDDLPDHPEFFLHPEVTLRSFVLGCEVVVKATNDFASIQLAEIILGVLEALLATSLESRLLPYRSCCVLNIKPSAFVVGLPEYRIETGKGEQTIEIRHAPAHSMAAEEQIAFRRRLLEIVAHTIDQIAVIDDANAYFDRLDREEVAFSRALDFADTSIFIKNILGDAPKYRLSDWKDRSSGQRFSLKRTLPWNDGLDPKNPNDTSTTAISKPEKRESPKKIFSTDHLKHRDR
jgi:hypothetical protein